MGSKRINATVGTLIGVGAGATSYLALGAATAMMNVPTAPIASGLFGALGAYMVISKRASARSTKSTLWTTEQKIAALNDHTLSTFTDADGLIVEVNDNLLDATGWKRSDLIGQPERFLVIENDFAFFDKVQRELAKGESWKGRNRLRKSDGTEILTDATLIPRKNKSGKVNGVISVRTDITQSQLLDSDRNIASILKRLRDEVYIFDANTLKFTYLNQAALESTGWSKDKITAKSLTDLSSLFDIKRFQALANPLLEDKAVQIRRTLTFNGRSYDADLQLIRNATESDQFVCVMRDATERLESERIKSEFVSTVSHELRSPMTSIKGAMGLVLSGSAGSISDKTRRLLEIAHRNSDRLVLIINDILDLEKIDAGRMDFNIKACDLSAAIKESIEAIGPLSTRFDVKLVTCGLDYPVIAHLDSNRIMQVLTNLLSNAVKFSPTGDTVTVSLKQSKACMRVEVSDMGQGIPEDQQDRIFERFSQVNENEGSGMRGTGLGLSIVKSIIEKHRGRVGLHSKEGAGTTMYFELPVKNIEIAEQPERLRVV